MSDYIGKPSSKRYDHAACEKCTFKGQMGKADIWHCDALEAIIVRRGDGVHDYKQLPFAPPITNVNAMDTNEAVEHMMAYWIARDIQ